ncbi:MAG: hypothetical protein ACD_11C00057G0017 [uncultured bacterium]|nr:MAG: hypothetical protein ACD_11C00057G0017 [uncultured bacterium]HBR71786.1 hypothetical protein [Candidatus Moranbacteria bacterium]
MKQTFFNELEEINKKEKQEKVEMYVRKSFFSGQTLFLLGPVVAIALFSIGALVYSLYIFVDITHMGNISNVHISDSFNLAKRTLQGNVYNNEEKGIKNWMIHFDNDHSFTIKHPDSWKVGGNQNHIFEIRLYNDQSSANESLAATIYIDRQENFDRLNLMDFVQQQTKINKNDLKSELTSGKEMVRTGKQVDAGGPIMDIVYWEKGGYVYFLKVLYYNKNNQIAESDFDKIVSEFNLN